MNRLEEPVNACPRAPYDHDALKRRRVSAKNTLLAADFEPGPNDVICKRGKDAWNHKGNQWFRHLVEANVENYLKCRSRSDKSLLVLRIVDTIRQASPQGGFVKQIEQDGVLAWCEVGDEIARDKVGHALRDVTRIATEETAKSVSHRESLKGAARRKVEEEAFPPTFDPFEANDPESSIPMGLNIFETPSDETAALAEFEQHLQSDDEETIAPLFL
jgi:hypothetical protein